jgi:hypothetical protein
MNGAAIWSAVAASFAALSSFLIMLIQRRNLLESVRPELVLMDWNKREEGSGDSSHEVVTFKTIRNIGRGPAIHVIVFSEVDFTKPLTALMERKRVPILAPNETMTIDGRVILWWKNVTPGGTEPRFLPIEIKMYCWDTRGMRHETRYRLLAVHPSTLVGDSDAVAPGVLWSTRTTTTRAVWLLKMQSRAINLGSKAKKSWNKLRDKFRSKRRQA